MIPAVFKKQVAADGLRFEAYLPPSLASWVIELVEQGVIHSPSEAVFVAMQAFEDLDRHPEVKTELLRAVIAHASKEAKEGKYYTTEEVMAKIKQRKSQPQSEPAVWDRSMEEPWFEE
jgi:Arc/MetJ-type ribon-helix-helix transcriptional regulator